MLFVASLSKKFYDEAMVQKLRNMPGMTWTPGIPNRFKDISEAEVTRMFRHFRASKNIPKVQVWADAPAAFDWATEKPECMLVRDQGSCGSCWAFAAVGSFSDTRCLLKVDPARVTYSEQYMVSCDPNDLGCDGGWLDMDEQFLQATGVPTDACVPYTSGTTGLTGRCPKTCKDGSVIKPVKSVGYLDVCTDEESIKNAIATYGTLQTGFTVYQDFMYYTKGIYQHKVNLVAGGHAVVFVGYGEENGVKYWKCRNSWGEWGEDGYFRILRGSNECAIEEECYQVKVK